MAEKRTTEKQQMNENIRIKEKDLYTTQFNEDILADNMDHLNKKRVLFTQTLTAEFCVQYLLCNNDNDNDGNEDSYLFDKQYIMDAQPHITEYQWTKAQQR